MPARGAQGMALVLCIGDETITVVVPVDQSPPGTPSAAHDGCPWDDALTFALPGPGAVGADRPIRLGPMSPPPVPLLCVPLPPIRSRPIRGPPTILRRTKALRTAMVSRMAPTTVFRMIQMKHILLLAALLAGTTAAAHDYTVGDISIAHPFALATVGNAPVGGGYMTITNAGTIDDVLIAVTVAAEVAGMVQLHEMTMDGGIMRMGEVTGGIPLPAGEAVTLESGGLHVMFMRLAGGLEEGTEIPATLTFEKAGTIDVVFDVEARGAAKADDHAGHGD